MYTILFLFCPSVNQSTCISKYHNILFMTTEVLFPDRAALDHCSLTDCTQSAAPYQGKYCGQRLYQDSKCFYGLLVCPSHVLLNHIVPFSTTKKPTAATCVLFLSHLSAIVSVKCSSPSPSALLDIIHYALFIPLKFLTCFCQPD